MLREHFAASWDAEGWGGWVVVRDHQLKGRDFERGLGGSSAGCGELAQDHFDVGDVEGLLELSTGVLGEKLACANR